MVLVKAEEMEQEAARRLTEVLSDVPFLSSLRSHGGPDDDIDFTISLRSKSGTQRLLCKVERNGQPRIVRNACRRLRDFVESGRKGFPVLIAPYLSPAATSICTQSDVGYLDFAGNCRLVFDQVFVLREGYPNPSVQKRDLRSLYSPKAERVLRVLLNTGPKAWKMQGLADEALVSLGQVANVKKLLLDREWAVPDTEGFRLASLDDGVLPLLEEWAANYRARRNRGQGFYTMRPLPDVEAALGSDSRVALAELSGAARLAPAVRYQRVTAYVQGDIMEAARAAGIKSVASGGNVWLVEPYDEGVFYGARGIDGIRIVSPVQLYLDLASVKGRGEEAATAILEEVIKPLWR